MYTVKQVGMTTVRVINVDRQAPYVRSNDDHFPDERQKPEEQEWREREANEDDDVSSLKDNIIEM